jgi:hypothetical protein
MYRLEPEPVVVSVRRRRPSRRADHSDEDDRTQPVRQLQVYRSEITERPFWPAIDEEAPGQQCRDAGSVEEIGRARPRMTGRMRAGARADERVTSILGWNYREAVKTDRKTSPAEAGLLDGFAPASKVER